MAEYREIIHSPRFNRELDSLLPGAKRADEFVRGAEWILSRNPETGHRISENSAVWMIALTELSETTPIVLYYTFDDEKVWFLSIQETEFDLYSGF